VLDAGARDERLVRSILEVLHARTGVDFSRYRRATLQRRIANRLISVGAKSLEAYLALLESSAEESAQLLNRVAIKVSRFYRNRASFDLLRNGLLARLAESTTQGRLRLWSAGCGCGEEPYSLAMLLEEQALAGELLASDIDPAALDAAADALYPEEAAAELPAELAARYLVPVRGARGRRLVAVRAPARSRVRFARHDLLADAVAAEPFDLVACRNVLIYLQGEAREQLFRSLLRSVRPGGCLLLGEAEWPSPDTMACLEALDGKARLFRRREGQR
jgi:chemotaxis methyl-accepting protein methylase